MKNCPVFSVDYDDKENMSFIYTKGICCKCHIKNKKINNMSLIKLAPKNPLDQDKYIYTESLGVPTQPTTNNLEGWEERFGKEYTNLVLDITGYKCSDKNGRVSREKVVELMYEENREKFKQFISDLRKHDMEELIKKLHSNIPEINKMIEKVIYKHFNN